WSLQTDTVNLSFFWLNMPGAPTPWYLLRDIDPATGQLYEGRGTDGDWGDWNTLSSMDDDRLIHNGKLNFTGPTFDLYTTAPSEPVEAVVYAKGPVDCAFGAHTACTAANFSWLERRAINDGRCHARFEDDIYQNHEYAPLIAPVFAYAGLQPDVVLH